GHQCAYQPLLKRLRLFRKTHKSLQRRGHQPIKISVGCLQPKSKSKILSRLRRQPLQKNSSPTDRALSTFYENPPSLAAGFRHPFSRSFQSILIATHCPSKTSRQTYPPLDKLP